MSALPNKNTVKLQQPNSLNNNKGLNNASMLNTKNLPKPVNTSMGDGSNQGIAQVSSSTLANTANNNQGISKDYINGIARDFSKTSSIKEKLALAKWLNKFAANNVGGTKTVSLNVSKNPPITQPSVANKPDDTPRVGDANYKNPKIRTYGEANNMTDEQIRNQESRGQVFFDRLGGFNGIDEQGKNFINNGFLNKSDYLAAEQAKSRRRMQNAKAIADQNQRSRQQWEAREAKGLNNLSREDYDRLVNEKVTYYDENGNAKEYAKYYGGYTQNGGLLHEMKMPKGMMTKEQYDAFIKQQQEEQAYYAQEEELEAEAHAREEERNRQEAEEAEKNVDKRPEAEQEAQKAYDQKTAELTNIAYNDPTLTEDEKAKAKEELEKRQLEKSVNNSEAAANSIQNQGYGYNDKFNNYSTDNALQRGLNEYKNYEDNGGGWWSRNVYNRSQAKAAEKSMGALHTAHANNYINQLLNDTDPKKRKEMQTIIGEMRGNPKLNRFISYDAKTGKAAINDIRALQAMLGTQYDPRDIQGYKANAILRHLFAIQPSQQSNDTYQKWYNAQAQEEAQPAANPAQPQQ